MKRFAKLRILTGMALLACVAAAAVILGSPYDAVISSAPERIEEIWDVEDARMESEKPLVTKLANHGIPLAYDAAQNTFYCTLGMGNQDTWPELYLTAPGRKDVQLTFVDDYSYDWCDEAIRKGYAYELMAYTDQAYGYFNIVFTGLPLLSITASEEITTQDSAAFVDMSAYGEQAVSTHARIHRRGGLSRGSEKPAYKIEYTRRANGTGKFELETPGLGKTDEMILLPMPFDRLMMRDRLSWDIYNLMTEGKGPFAARPSTYAEVVINGKYMGVYLLMLPFDVSEELYAVGASHLLSDCVYRTCVAYMSEGRQLLEHPIREDAGYELFYSPEEKGAFVPLKPYMELLEEEDDTLFEKKAMQLLDIQDMLCMQILLQAGGMTDNVFNNLYIWAEKTSSGYVYHYIPWDMDLSWGLKKEDIGENFENWMYFPIADRLIELDPEGMVRSELADMWRTMKERALNLGTIERLTDQYEHELNDSGAMLRNAERWETECYAADGQEILDYAEIRFALLDETIERIVDDPEASVLFLERTQYEGKGSPMEW